MASTAIKPDKTTAKDEPFPKVPMLLLIGETKERSIRRCPARFMFTNVYWKGLMTFAEQFQEVRIVSSKWGLLPLDQEIDPYEEDFRGFGVNERHEWIIRTKAKILDIQVECKTIYCLAAGLILRALATMDLRMHCPLAGASDRRRRDWIDKQNRGLLFDMVIASAMFSPHHPALTGPLDTSFPAVLPSSF